ncbi:hypothetical protein EYF80_046805 [Liparis tanakae]|uniref:Uncharacterized protein n=1 Tax=Liparis tanakae TaxID=230148 RepID=A0A4Z2FPC5_9TELE|nr:hypothetical protein EYF80_046805 [Liparis tanakae]
MHPALQTPGVFLVTSEAQRTRPPQPKITFSNLPEWGNYPPPTLQGNQLPPVQGHLAAPGSTQLISQLAFWNTGAAGLACTVQEANKSKKGAGQRNRGQAGSGICTKTQDNLAEDKCKSQYELLLSMVGPSIARQETNWWETISPSERLSICLRVWGVSPQVAERVTKATCVLHNFLHWETEDHGYASPSAVEQRVFQHLEPVCRNNASREAQGFALPLSHHLCVGTPPLDRSRRGRNPRPGPGWRTLLLHQTDSLTTILSPSDMTLTTESLEPHPEWPGCPESCLSPTGDPPERQNRPRTLPSAPYPSHGAPMGALSDPQ